MSSLKIIAPLLLLSFITLPPAFAQDDPPPPAAPRSITSSPLPIYRLPSLKTLKLTEPYYGLADFFSIALPKYPIERKLTEKDFGIDAQGVSFKWNTEEALITIIFVSAKTPVVIKTSEDYSNYEAQILYNLEQGAKAKVISSERIKLGDYPGVGMIVIDPNGKKVLSRSYVLENFQVSLLATLSGTQLSDQALAMTALDSFKILTDADRAANKARRIEAGTPKPLPQTPAVARPVSDVKIARLSGKVKAVIEESEYPDEKTAAGHRFLERQDDYDEKGGQIKSIDYNIRNQPSTITAYGYIDEARVSKSGHIDYGDDPPAPIMAAPGTIVKPRDERYSTKYFYSYDDKKRLKEILAFSNDGELSWRYTYVYNGDIEEKVYSSANGKYTRKETLTVDKKGNVVHRTYLEDNRYPSSEYDYKYEMFDKKGNWTKRIVTGKSGNRDGTTRSVHVIEYRTITYY